MFREFTAVPGPLERAPAQVQPGARSARQVDAFAEGARRLLRLGVGLFLLGLLTGFAVPLAANPRMALSSHLEGVMNGLFLIVLGLVWGHLRLGPGSRRLLVWFAAYGTFANWATTLVAALWGAGASMMPLAAAGFSGTSAQEGLIAFGLLSLSGAMLVVCPLMLWGLRARPA